MDMTTEQKLIYLAIYLGRQEMVLAMSKSCGHFGATDDIKRDEIEYNRRLAEFRDHLYDNYLPKP